MMNEKQLHRTSNLSSRQIVYLAIVMLLALLALLPSKASAADNNDETVVIGGVSYHVLRSNADWERLLTLVQEAKGNSDVNAIMDADYTVTTSHGAYFSRYTSNYGDAYEKAAAALSVGEVSGVVEGTDGYYVILRLPLEEDYVMRNFETIASDYITSQFNIQLDDFRKNNKFEFNEYGSGLDLLAIE